MILALLNHKIIRYNFFELNNLELFYFSIINIIKNILRKLNVNFKNFSLYNSYLLSLYLFLTSFR
jgi:hypothetical protein